MRPRQQQLMAEREADDSSYGSCLIEDVQLFSQLANFLPAAATVDDLDLIQLTDPVKPIIQNKPKRAQPTRRPANNDCDLCGRHFSDGYSLRIHRMTHTNERPHVCGVCGKGFRQLNKLRIHSITHTDERPYKCDICGKGFRFANYLSVHRRLHTGEKPYACTEAGCSLFFHSIHARRMHVKLHHASNGELVEEVLEEDDEGILRRQKKETCLLAASTAALNFTCPICGRVLSDQCYLNTHLKRHYNQRDYACQHPGCGKRFFSSSELNHHQIAHTRLRPFRCSLCGSRFLRNSNYKQHLKVHKAKGCD